MSIYRWRTKAAACLLRETGASTVEEGVSRIVQAAKKAAFEQGYSVGTLRPPYDPKPLALVLGAKEVRRAALGFDGHVAREADGLIIEYDSENRSRRRLRFTVAHEVGHLALWKATRDVRKLPARRSPKGSEIEKLCNKIGAEILAPRNEVKVLWGDANARSAVQSKADFILRLSETFDISLNFAAIQFREVCSPGLGIALINLPHRRYEWCHGVPSKYRLLQGLLEKLGNAESFGADSFFVGTSYGVRMVAYHWRKIAEAYFLILFSR